MYVVRNVFQAKPGKAKEAAAKFKAAAPHFGALGLGETRVMTDAVAGFWTVVVESQIDDLAAYMRAVEGVRSEEIGRALAGYMDLVEGGRREIFRIE